MMQNKPSGQAMYEAYIKSLSILDKVPIGDFPTWDELSLHEQLVWNMTAQFVRDELMVTVPLGELPNLDIQSPEGLHPDGDANQSLSRGQAALRELQKKTVWDKDKR